MDLYATRYTKRFEKSWDMLAEALHSADKTNYWQTRLSWAIWLFSELAKRKCRWKNNFILNVGQESTHIEQKYGDELSERFWKPFASLV
jgi:hypothetical protein